MIAFPFSILLSVKLVKEYQRIVILRLGRVVPRRAVGTVYIIPFIDAFHIVDLRLVTFSIEPQQILTRDSVAIQVDAIVFYRVSNAIISIINVEHAHRSIQLLAQTCLMNTIGLHSIYEVTFFGGFVVSFLSQNPLSLSKFAGTNRPQESRSLHADRA